MYGESVLEITGEVLRGDEGKKLKSLNKGGHRCSLCVCTRARPDRPATLKIRPPQGVPLMVIWRNHIQ